MPDLADLLFDEVEVVEQPFRGGRDRTALVGSLGDAAVGSQQRSLSARALDQRHGRRQLSGNKLVGSGAFRMLFQAFDAEELAADGIAVNPIRKWIARARRRARE